MVWLARESAMNIIAAFLVLACLCAQVLYREVFGPNAEQREKIFWEVMRG
jgi:hypothetical protein